MQLTSLEFAVIPSNAKPYANMGRKTAGLCFGDSRVASELILRLT